MAEGARLCADAARSGTAIAACFYTEAAAEKYGEYLRPVLRAAERAYCIAEHCRPAAFGHEAPAGDLLRLPDAGPRGRGGAGGAGARARARKRAGPRPTWGRSCAPPKRSAVLHIALVGACCDLYSPKVLRGSMGAVFRLGVERYEAAPACAEALGRRGLTSLAAVPDAQAVPITAIPFDAGRWAVWIGNEGTA